MHAAPARCAAQLCCNPGQRMCPTPHTPTAPVMAVRPLATRDSSFTPLFCTQSRQSEVHASASVMA